MKGNGKAEEAAGTHMVRQAGRVYVGNLRELGNGEFWFTGRRVGGTEILEGKFNADKISALKEGKKKDEERK